MAEQRVKVSQIVSNQLPEYVRLQYPQFVQFLTQYYQGQEYPGAPLDLIQNIDSYIKINENGNTVGFTSLSNDIDVIDNSIQVDSTSGFPEKYGLLKINDEIITYSGITSTSFTGCVRGFSGITSFTSSDNIEDLVFSNSEASSHSEGDNVENLSRLFLQEFFKKIKKQYLYGLGDQKLTDNLNKSQFIRSAKDFYSIKGTDASFKILFKALFGENVEIVRPSDYVISPSNAIYQKTKDLVAEFISGDPYDLVNKTLYQSGDENIPEAYAPVSKVEKVSTGSLNTDYYRISIDGSYLKKEGSNTELIYDNFSIHPKTKCIGEIGIGQTFIDVDSTVGFPNSGSLDVVYNDFTTDTITYSNKTINQFLDVSVISKRILDESDVNYSSFAYSAGLGRTDGIKLRIRSVIGEYNIPKVTYQQNIGSKIKIKSLGKIGNKLKENNWIFNNSQSYNVESLELIDSRNFVYRLTTIDDNILRVGDTLRLKSLNDVFLTDDFTVTTIINNKISLIRGSDVENPNGIVSVNRILNKVKTDIHPQLSKFTANVQNVYIDNDDDSVLVASNSLPYFESPTNPDIQKIILSGLVANNKTTLKVTEDFDHNFFTGDSIYYTPNKDSDGNIISKIFDEGLYFVHRVDSNNVKLAKSRSDLYNEKYVTIDDLSGKPNVDITNHIIEKYAFNGKIIEPQKLIRKIPNIHNQRDDEVNEKLLATKAGATGIFINGVEILNYKSHSYVHYGEIEEINLTSPGFGYDVINPPLLSISDSVGSGATGVCGVKGNFVDIDLIDGGFDYLDIPSIQITGGNGKSAKASANTTFVDHTLSFDSSNLLDISVDFELRPGFGGISTETSKIGFSTYHRFKNGESVVYKTLGGNAVTGLSTDSTYYVNVVNDYDIKLHLSKGDALASSGTGINTISLSDFGTGNHSFTAIPKLSVSSIRIIDPGFDYENKKRICSSSGINTSINTIDILNHGYKTGEIIRYSFNETSIGGLSTTKDYIVTTINNDSFKLSDVGIGSDLKYLYFNRNVFKNLTSSGSGLHTFNYPEISVKVIGKVGVTSIGEDTFEAKVQPIVRGELTSIHLTNNGQNYGTSRILNLKRLPKVSLISGTDAALKPVILNGQIVNVVILNSGKDYTSIPDLIVRGTGTSGKLVPILKDGAIVDVKISRPGVGYEQNSTSIEVLPAGNNAEFESVIQSWRVNEVRKNLSNVKDDDIFVSPSMNDGKGLQCYFAYGPRNLRKLVYSTDRGGRILYGRNDLRIVNGLESSNINHSPIIGWAYDGSPIYGPYGYKTNKGTGGVTQLKSGYTLKLSPNRPPLVNFPEGFFVEDFEWSYSSSEDTLDENNGRFCITPEFPNGIYAYFTTFDAIPSEDGVFKNFKAPTFPYVIGNSYHKTPDEFNFKKRSNQDDINLNDFNISRNTYPYLLSNDNSGYDYLVESYKFTDQDPTITSVNRGNITSIGIVSEGINYQVDDTVVLDASTTSRDFGQSNKVSLIGGVGVSSISCETFIVPNLEFYPNGSTVVAVHTTNHNISNNEALNVVGLSTEKYIKPGQYTVGISSLTFELQNTLNAQNITGIVTYINIKANTTSFFSDLKFVEPNDVYNLYANKTYAESVRVLLPQVGTAITSKALDPESNPTRFTDAAVYDYIWDNYDEFDVDGDGVVSFNDAIVIVRHLYGDEVKERGAFSGNRIFSTGGGISGIGYSGVPAAATRTTNREVRDFLDFRSFHSREGNIGVSTNVITGIQTGYLFYGSDPDNVVRGKVSIGQSVNSTFVAAGTTVTAIGKNSITISNTTTNTETQVGTSITFGNGLYDVDGNGQITVFSDGIMIARVFGPSEFKNPSDNGIAGFATDNTIFDTLKVLNIDPDLGRIRVLRTGNGTYSGVFGSNSELVERSRKVEIPVIGISTVNDSRKTYEYYFNPTESIGIGEDISAGAGTTITFTNPGAGQTQVFVPTRAIYLPYHTLRTGDKVTYKTNVGDTIGVSTVSGGSSVPLTQYSELYVGKINDNFIGLSTVKVTAGTADGIFVGVTPETEHHELLYFVGLGTGVYHSLTFNNPETVTGNLEKNIVTVSTSSTHGLSLLDNVFVEVKPNINETIKVKYNKSIRKLIVNEYDYVTSGISSENRTISITDHKLSTGQKVINFLNTSINDDSFKDEGEYYVYVVDRNTIKLTNEKYELFEKTPSFIGLSTLSSGSLSLINPPLNLVKNSTVKFDLSDSSLSYVQNNISYSAFRFDFYRDSSYKDIYVTNELNSLFAVSSEGQIGVTAGANYTLTVNDNTPNRLYYKLTPIDLNQNVIENKQISVDKEVEFFNSIFPIDSDYSGKHTVTGIGSTSFSYLLSVKPEASAYISTNTSLSYNTTSSSAYGPIKNISVGNGGKYYSEIPGISEIVTGIGTGAILNVFSDSIGKINSVRIDDIGFDYPSDLTLKPEVYIPQILRVEQLSKFKSISIITDTQGATGPTNIFRHNIPPKLVVVDGITNKVVDDAILKMNLPEKKVDILQNTFSLSDAIPKLIPTENVTGIGFTSLTYDISTKEVTVSLTNAQGPKFANLNQNTTEDFVNIRVGDNVLVENVSVGVGTTGTGYNSSNYNYKLFPVVGVTTATGIVTFSMSSVIEDDYNPGKFISNLSSPSLLPERLFPKFSIELDKTGFKESEIIKSGSKTGEVIKFDSFNKLVHIESADEFFINDVIISESSGTKAIIKGNTFFESRLDLDYYSIIGRKWSNTTGFISDNLQRVHDNDYYQYFSYAVKSKIGIDKWDESVSTLNHAAGFKKFSDLQIESSVPTSLSMKPTIEEVTTVFITLDNIVDLNCYDNFDLVHENLLISDGNRTFSNEINFTSTILTDYDESISNRVVNIDDVSGEFNSNPRSTPFSEIFRTLTEDTRSQKFITYVRDRTFVGERQLMVATVLTDTDRALGMINQYGTVYTQSDLGSLDYVIDGNDGVLRFYPTKYQYNNYNVSFFAYSLEDIVSISTVSSSHTVGISSELAGKPQGSIASIGSSEILTVGTAVTNLVVISGIGTTLPSVRSAKVLVNIEVDDGQTEFNELNVIHNGTDAHLLEFGQLNAHSIDTFGSSGLGTYGASVSSDNELIIEFTPAVGLGTTAVISANTITVGLSTEIYNNQNSGLGSESTLSSGTLMTKCTELIGGSAESVVEFSSEFDAAYSIIQVADLDNDMYQMSEAIIVSDGTDAHITEFGNVETNHSLGEMTGGVNSGITQITFTPAAGVGDLHVKSFTHAIKVDTGDDSGEIDLDNSKLITNSGTYTGTELDVRKDFEILHKTYPVFKRVFDGSDSSFVDVANNKIILPYHFFTTGEKVEYRPKTGIGTNSIGIDDITVGSGTTDKLPTTVYVIKLSESEIRFAQTAENALKPFPEPITITSVGINSDHSITSTNQNQRVLISIDNYIQSPIVSTSVTTSLADQVLITEDSVKFSGITSFFSGDYIKIDDEIMRIRGVGIGSTNAITVFRAWAGTSLAGHSTDSLVTKIKGNYNIIGNTLNFIEAPFGNNPISSTTNAPSERDWEGITTSSSFHARAFMKTGVVGATTDTYAGNYIFDDISQNFSGSEDTYTITSGNSNVVGISTNNAIVLINGILQEPGLNNDFTITEDSDVGISSIKFTGTASATSTDPNSLNVPVGGIIVSVASSRGLGYQPLISAGATAVISVGNTVESITIGNTGSGYRSNNIYEIETTTKYSVGVGSTNILLSNTNSALNIINLNTSSTNTIAIGTYIKETTSIVSIANTFVGIGSTSPYEIPAGTSVKIQIENPDVGIVNVGVATTSLGIANITHVGFSTINAGFVTSVTITNGGDGFSSINPPYVIFDEPLPYSNIPLVYSETSVGSGGTQAKVNITVGQGSSVIDFEIINQGYGYGQGHVLTIPTGGITGIPTDSSIGTSFEEFKLTIQETLTDEFSAWFIGEIEPLDDFSDLFDGSRKTFSLFRSGNRLSVQSDYGSIVNVDDVLIVFINDILQIPGDSYTFSSGSTITFSEAPKSGDRLKVLFYKGTSGTDVLPKEVTNEVHEGDELIINYDKSLNQNKFNQQDNRSVYSVLSSGTVKTNSYYGPGLLSDSSIHRPVTLCKQTEDKMIEGFVVNKDREQYEPTIFPTAHLITNIGIGSTIAFVDNIRPFFNPSNEASNLDFQNDIIIVENGEKVSAAATAIVGDDTLIQSIVISENGVGYSTATVSIASTDGTLGVGTTAVAKAYAIISIGGTINSIAITTSGIGYTNTNPPSVLISPPQFEQETNKVVSFEGDFGIIVGVGTTNVGVSTGIAFDLIIPQDSYLRDTSIVGTATTLTGLKEGYYFTVFNSNVGYGVTSLDENNEIVGIGTTCLDNVYRVSGITTALERDIIGYGSTYVTRVIVSISTYYGLDSDIPSPDQVVSGFTTDFFGKYSWGRLMLSQRTGVITYSAQTNNGVVGINTGSFVRRKNSLKFRNYTT